MKKFVTMGAGLVLALTTAAVPVAPAIAQEDGETMYERIYYDDPEMTIQVGSDRDTCNYYGIGGTRTEGRYGPYIEYRPIARCVNGQLQPLL